LKIEFTKMSGAGNDFVVLGPSYAALRPKLSWLATKMCPRRVAVGADGLILVEKQGSGLFMHYFNRDGSEASFCGNGARCLVRYCLEKGIASGKVEFRSGSGAHAGEARADGIAIDLKMPVLMRKLELSWEGGPQGRTSHEIYLVDAGVPHAVVFATNVAAVDVEGVGRAIRYHPEFAPDGANVDFVEAAGAQPFSLRTYERGVEAETLACGSGCVAAALALRLERGMAGTVRLTVASGDVISVDLGSSPDGPACLTGPATLVYEGEIEIKELDHV
jgi:diaminopimelate epimerase